MCVGGGVSACVCEYVCVCVRVCSREREGVGESETLCVSSVTFWSPSFHSIVQYNAIQSNITP